MIHSTWREEKWQVGGGAVCGKDIPEGNVWEPPFAREMEHLIV